MKTEKKNVTNRPDFCTDNNQFINDCGIGLTLIYLSLYMNAELITYLHLRQTYKKNKKMDRP